MPKQQFVRRMTATAVPTGLLVAAAALAFPPGAGAADGYFLPQASAESRYNDNWRLAPDEGQQEEISALGTFLELSSQFGWRTQRSDLSLTPRLRSSFFADSEDDDRLASNDKYLLFSGYRDTETSRYAVTGESADESVLTSEIADLDSDDPGDDVGDTGRLDVQNDRQRIIVRPSWSYRYSEQTELGLGYRYTDVSYDNELVTRQVDYTDNEASFNFGRQMTPRTLLNTRLFAGRFEADEIGNQSDSTGIDFEFDRQMSERVTGTANIGAQRIESEFMDPLTGLPVDESNTSLLFGLGLRTAVSEATNWNANLSRRVNPNGTGFLVQTDQLLLTLDHAFGPRLRGTLGTRMFRNEAVDDNENVQFTERDYARLEAGLEWSLTPTWSLFSRYSYTRQEFDRPPPVGGVPPGDEASANAISIGIAYRGRLPGT
jgi:opacity protein-like surface antigen